MTRSGSQKVLLVMSILEIIEGAFAFIFGIMATFAGGLLGGSLSAPENLAEMGLTPDDAGMLTAATSFVAIVLIIGSIISIIEGVLGIRAANDSSKIMPVWILAIVGIVCTTGSLIMTIVNGQFAQSGISSIIALAIDAVMFWIANNIKGEAGL